MSNRFYALISTGSERGETEEWSIKAGFSEQDIIDMALAECAATNEDLEFWAGFEIIGGFGANQLTWSRDWMPGEQFRTSVLKLNDEGRTFRTYNVEKHDEVRTFLSRAKEIGLESTARELIAEHSPQFVSQL